MKFRLPPHKRFLNWLNSHNVDEIRCPERDPLPLLKRYGQVTRCRRSRQTG
jgi:hypothetical protein